MGYRWFGIIGIGIFAYLLLNIDLQYLASQFKNINLPLFSLSLMLAIPCIFVKAFKWLLLVEPKERIPVPKAMLAWIVGFGYGLITPARLGDFLRAKFLKIKLSNGLPTVLVDRLNDVLALFIFGILCVFVVVSRAVYLLNLAYLFIFFFVLFLIGIFVLRNRTFVVQIGKPFYKFFVPRKFKKFVGKNFDEFYGVLEKMNRRAIILNFVFTISAWLISFAQYWLLALAFGLDLSYLAVCLVSPILLLVQLIPISISGIGTREAASVLLLKLFGIKPELAILFSLGILIEDYILGGFGLAIGFKVK